MTTTTNRTEPPGARLDLDDLERKALAIVEWDPVAHLDGQECIVCHGAMHCDSEPTPMCNPCAQFSVETTAQIMLALIACIREMDGGLDDAADYLRAPTYAESRSEAQRRRDLADRLRALISKGAALS